MTASTPPGFAPRSGIPPLWMHSIELDPDQALAGIVIVVRRDYLPAVANLLGYAHMRDRMVHALGEEHWLRLDWAEAIRLRHGLGRLYDDHADHIPGAYGALVNVENIVDREDD